MPVLIQCPACGKPTYLHESFLGRLITCPACGRGFMATAPGSGASNSSGPWFLRWPVLVAGGMLAVIVVFGAVFLLTRNKGARPAIADKPQAPAAVQADATGSPPPAAPMPTLSLLPVAEIVLEPGTTSPLELKLQRNGVAGPIQVQLEGLPDVVTAQPVEVPEGKDAARLELAVAAETGEAEIVKPVRLLATAGEASAEQEVKLTVKRVLPLRVQPISATTLKPGGTASVPLVIERNGHEGPIQIKVEDLPEKVTAPVVQIAAGESSGSLKINAAADAKELQASARVIATVGPRKAEAPLVLHVERFPFKLSPLPVVTLQPGESKSIEVSVERRSYRGLLQLAVEGLPEGVTVAAAEIAADQKSGRLELTAAAEAKERVRSAKIVSRGGEVQTQEPLIVRVSSGEGSFLPEDIAVDPELSRLLRRGSFGGRLQASSKQALLEVYGGTEESEAAVRSGLAWLARHQEPDGSWKLDKYHENKPGCDCRLEFEAEVKEHGAAATAFGLLPFLAAGVTHKSAPDTDLAQYKSVVMNGLVHLTRNQVASTDPLKDGNLGGGMYAHALGTMALCEAYGMSGDPRLKVPAQRAIKYLVQAQHPTTGGWRYSPRQPGDMSVVGWVFLAIRSGQMSGVLIERHVLEKADKFLDSCGAGPPEAKMAQYSYEPGGSPRLALSAAGLLSRQYVGWKREEPALAEGQKLLMANLPPESGTRLGPIYYYYYATQVLHHLEGEEWDKWNHYLREHLIRTQETSGHKQGSWSPEGTDHGARGGRLYSTSLAILTLEAYYRHLPLYRRTTK